ncbi:MAG: BrxA/BrxB family bacilliredoxin, partial [Acidobacteriota bacterium]
VPMRADLTRHGVEEARTPEAVDRLIAEQETLLMIVNSVCGCAAGRARPAVGMALKNAVKPAKTATVFAGGDDEAVAHLRTLLAAAGYPPSSPSMAIFKNGKPVHMLHRSDIERRDPNDIANLLVEAFEEFC